MEEKCQRCGEVGQDRRTLWMACLYQMRELGLPFTLRAIRGRVAEQIGTETSEAFGFELPIFAEEDPNVEPAHFQFYCMRVCKTCRGSWMQAIKRWFSEVPQPRESPGTGVFVREFGAVREVTHDEFQQQHPGKTPFRLKPLDDME